MKIGMNTSDTVPNPARMVGQLTALAQGSRLAVMRLLARYQPFGLPAGDIARLVAVPHNTMSTHLALLEAAGLVRSRRDGRQIIFALDSKACAMLAQQVSGVFGLTGAADPPAVPRASIVPVVRQQQASEKPWRVLVLCTANSARSLMAEALINREGKGRFVAVSAGSQPAGAPHPEALRLLAGLGYGTAQLAAKDWRAFSAEGVTPFDVVITVCDAAKGEPCPAWPGHPLGAHWGIADPAAAPMPEQRAAMLDAYRKLSVRVTSLVNLPIETMELASLKAALVAIARLEGATPLALELAA
jgi:ArsR family transcriptional regulator, arsenate/arsenite/antimonite-responsive transcriptional repressor / arsenate reductase (thioredoxin)